MAAVNRRTPSGSGGDLSWQPGNHCSARDAARRRVAVVGAGFVAWLRRDGSALLLQHDVVAQGETIEYRCRETEDASEVARRACRSAAHGGGFTGDASGLVAERTACGD